MTKNTDHRREVAAIKKAWYRELRASGWTAKDAKNSVDESIMFIDSLQRTTFNYGCELVVN